MDWHAMVFLGAYHGINPGMGWLFAVALGMQRGSARGVWDAAHDRALLTFGSDSIRTFEIRNSGGPVWRELSTLGKAGWGGRYGTVLDPIVPQIARVLPGGTPTALWFGALPTVSVTAIPSARFAQGTVEVNWQVASDRPLYGPFTVEQLAPAGPIWLVNFSADPGFVTIYSPLGGADHGVYRLSWFDGNGMQHVPDFEVDGPPPPTFLQTSVSSITTAEPPILGRSTEYLIKIICVYSWKYLPRSPTSTCM